MKIKIFARQAIRALLVLCMVLTIFPLTAHANNEPGYNCTVHNKTSDGRYIGAGINSVNRDIVYGNITIPGSYDGYTLTDIGARSFKEHLGLVSVTIPNSITNLDASAFESCTNLKSVTIGNGVTRIGASAFRGCTSLTSVTLGSGVTTIGENAFRGCNTLESITIPEGVTTIEDGAFRDCTNLQSIVIPDSVTSIGNYAFKDCTYLTSLTLGDGVKTIGTEAFCNCESVETLTLGDNLESIGEGAFRDSGIDAISFGSSLKIIGANAFRGCGSLGGSVVIPSSVTSIGDYAFNMSSITSLTIQNSTCSIGTHSFDSCTSLSSISLGNNITGIGEYAFKDCSKLESIVIPSTITKIPDNAFYNCILLTDVTIPNSVTAIGNSAFENCTKLSSINLPSSINAIGNSAFSGCSDLEEFIIPANVSSIGSMTFSSCKKLTTIIMSDNIQSIGSYAFDGCNSLSDIYYAGSSAQWAQINVSTSGNGPLLDADLHYGSGPSPVRNTPHYISFPSEEEAAAGHYSLLWSGATGNDDDGYVFVEEVGFGITLDVLPGYIEGPDFAIYANGEPLTDTNTSPHHAEYIAEPNRWDEDVEITVTGIVPSISILMGDQTDSPYEILVNGSNLITVAQGTDVNISFRFNPGYVADEDFAVYFMGDLLDLVQDPDDSSLYTCTIANIQSKEYERLYEVHGFRNEVASTLTKKYVPYKKATPTEDGYMEHYEIEETGDWFWDEACISPIIDHDNAIVPKVSNIRLNYTSYTYNGSVKTPTPIVQDSTGATLRNGIDYTYTASSGRKNVGTYTYKVTLKGDKYEGSKNVSFVINPKGSTIKTPYRYKGAIRAKWYKQSSKMASSRIYGYQIAYSTNSDFSGVKYKYAKGYKKTSYKISKLKRKTYYYVKVRTRMKVGGKWYYSPWSKVKKVRTK